jgi:hypothetical protein
VKALCVQMTKDHDYLEDAFSPFELKNIDRHEPFAVLTEIVEMIQCSNDVIKTHWKKLRDDYQDLTFHHVEAILCHRGNSRDLVKKFIADILLKGENVDHLERAKAARTTPFFVFIAVDDSITYALGKK